MGYHRQALSAIACISSDFLMCQGLDYSGFCGCVFLSSCFCSNTKFRFPTKERKRERMGNKGQLNKQQMRKVYTIIRKR